MTPSQRFYGCMTAFRADTGVEIPDSFQQFCHGHTGIALFETQSARNLTDHFQIYGFHTVVQKTIVADFLKTGGQHMHQITPYKFRLRQGYPAPGISRFFPSGREGNLVFCQSKDPAAPDGNLVCVSSKIFNGIAETVKGFLDIRAPVHFIKLVFPLFPVVRITQLFTGRRKCEGTAFIKRGKVCHIFALELVRQDFRAYKKGFGSLSYFSILRKTAT